MAQFDVHANATGHLLVDCQADVLDHLSTRFVVPLIDPDIGLRVVARLNPMFEVQDQQRIFFCQYATTIPLAELGKPIASLSHEHYRIMAALDMLISGF